MAERTLAENVAQVKADFKNIRHAAVSAIPEGTPTSEYGERIQREIMNLQQQADSQYNHGLEEGRQAQYDEFWDALQNYGKRADYAYAFATGWNDKTFTPKYDIIPTGCTNTFYYSDIGNLEGILNNRGVVLDTSKVINITYGFGYSTITHIPVVNLSKATNTTYLFANFGNTSTLFSRNRLVSIRKIISSETTVFAKNTFSGTYHLEHCIFEGTIASSINLQWSSKLDLESGISLLECLCAYTADDANPGAYTKTVTLPPEVWSLLDPHYDGNAQEYVLGKGWNVA